MPKFFLLFVCSILTFPLAAICLPLDRGKQAAKKVAEAYGIASFQQISRMRFTFHLQQDTLQVRREWIWNPKTGQAELVASDSNGTPPVNSRNAIFSPAGEEARAVDSMFIHDQCRLLFPFHLAWDKKVIMLIEEHQPLPVGKGYARRLSLIYPSRGGYTPGDVYRVYINRRNHIVQLEYYCRGEGTAGTITKWTRERKVGPLLISMDRPGAEKHFRIWFTDVSIMRAGSDTWITVH